MSLRDRFSSAWNAFQSEDRRSKKIQENSAINGSIETATFVRQDRYRMSYSSEYSILNSVCNRIANDVASTKIQHVRVDENDRYLETIKSGLNSCITLSANIDQTSRDFWVDMTLSMLDEGAVAIVPVDTDEDIVDKNAFDILSIRTGKILQWFPSYVQVEVYNDRSGKKEPITLPKDKIGIIENPFYSVMNEPNSTLRRLVYKMNLLDQIDGDRASSKMNMLVQLPYSLKSPAQKSRAEERRKAIEEQLIESKYGIAYIDSTEHVTQLNRPIENDLPQQIQDLTNQFYDQIGIGAEVFKGTANPEQLLLYNKKVLKPILDAIELEFTRKFLTQTARTQGQKIAYFIDAFDLVTPDEVGAMANAFSRNEILSANEFRAILGYKPNDDPRSDQLINKNMPIDQVDPNAAMAVTNQNGSTEELPTDRGELEGMAGGNDLDDLAALLNDDSGDKDLDETEALLDALERELDQE